MQIFTNTPIQTTFHSGEELFVLQVLGCGWVIAKSQTAFEIASGAGFKFHTIFGRKVGFSLFTRSL